MNPLLSAVTAALFAIAGALLGWWLSRLPKPWWALGYFFALVLIIAYVAGNRFPILSVTPPFSWIVFGRKKYAIFALIASLVLTIPLLKLPRKQDRNALGFLIVLLVCFMSIWPCLEPVFARNELEHLHTMIDADGICLQTTGYTCGPASAVTALRKLGLPAEEGKVAIITETSSKGGTSIDVLTENLQQAYAKDGLTTEYRVFKDIGELKNAGLTLAVVKFGLFVDHFVTVLEVTDTEVVVGDPAEGLRHLSYDEFLKMWRYEGVVLKRKQP